MSQLATGLARWLHAEGLGVYDPTGTAGDVYVMWLPDAPDAVIGIEEQAGGAPDALGYTTPRVRVYVRGGRGEDPRPAGSRALELWERLNGLRYVQLDDTLWLGWLFAEQSAPTLLPFDPEQRPIHQLSFMADIDQG